MPFAPVINDVGARILAQKVREKEDREAAVLTGILNQVNSNVSQAANMLAERDAMKQAGAGALTAIEAAGLLDGEQVSRLREIRDPVQFAAAMDYVGKMVDRQEMGRQRIDEINLRAGLAALEQMNAQQNDRSGETFVATDPLTGEQRSFIRQSNGSVMPFSPQGQRGGEISRVDLGNGEYAFRDAAGNWVPKSAVRGGQAGEDPLSLAVENASAAERQKAEREIAEMQQQIQKGNVRPGPDWLPDWVSAPYTQRVNEKRAAVSKSSPLEDVTETPPLVEPIVDLPTEPDGVPEYKTREDVILALRQGAISRDQAKQILQQQFGMK